MKDVIFPTKNLRKELFFDEDNDKRYSSNYYNILKFQKIQKRMIVCFHIILHIHDDKTTTCFSSFSRKLFLSFFLID